MPNELIKPYAEIIKEAQLNDGNASRAKKKAKDACQVILDYWTRSGFIKGWGVYSTATEKERGVYIELPEVV